LNPFSAPLVSIGLPVYNAAPFLQLCLQSIFAQTCQDWELLIVNDGSQDESLALLREICDARVHIFNHETRQGLAACLNRIAERARGKFLARMDADDLMHPTRLARQVNFLQKNSEVDCVGCDLAILDRNLVPVGWRAMPSDHGAICANPLRGFRIAHATVVGRLKWFRSNAYNESNRGCEDWELWASSFERSRFANISEPLYFYRELESFTVPKYLQKKITFAAHLWARRSQFGLLPTLVECSRQCAGMATYGGAALVGATDRLLIRRNHSLDQTTRNLVLHAIEQVQQAVFPTMAKHSS
jgi:hypothetical protein